MNEVLCKVISALNSTIIQEHLKRFGYTYSIVALKNYNTILRNKVTLDYNIKIFDASNEQIDALCSYIIKNIFNDKYIKLLINNNICMLSYNHISNINNNNNDETLKLLSADAILTNYLGKASYTYSLDSNVLHIIVDIKSNMLVSKWKESILANKDNIISQFKNINLHITSIDIRFSYKNIELDELANTFLDIGYYIQA